MHAKKTDQYVAKRLTFEKDSLELALTKYESYMKASSLWQLFLALVVTFSISFLATEMTITGNKTAYEQFVIIGLVVTALAFIVTFVMAQTKRNPVDELRTELFKKYINKPDRNALFVVKRKLGNEDQILVNKCKTWNCYFLPYVRVTTADVEAESIKKIASKLGYLPENIKIKMLLEKHEISEKYHPQEKVVKEYHSYYFHLIASSKPKPRNISNEERIEINDVVYEWKSLEDIEQDDSTKDKNKDVLDMLRENKYDFITNTSAF